MRDIVVFGAEAAFSLIVNLAITLIVGLVFRKSFEMLMFFIPFSVLRSLSGGIHAKTFARCVLASSLTIAAVAIAVSVDLRNIELPLSVAFTGKAITCNRVLEKEGEAYGMLML